MKVRINKDNAYFYPDVMVCCDANDRKRKKIKHSPVVVVEVLSASTEAYDRGDKFAIYRQLESLKEYVLINPHKYQIDLFRLNEVSGNWELLSYAGEKAEIELNSLGFHCLLLDLYEDVDL